MLINTNKNKDNLEVPKTNNNNKTIDPTMINNNLNNKSTNSLIVKNNVNNNTNSKPALDILNNNTPKNIVPKNDQAQVPVKTLSHLTIPMTNDNSSNKLNTSNVNNNKDINNMKNVNNNKNLTQLPYQN
jgi:hypothetical protein